jgi:hypothetical protein
MAGAMAASAFAVAGPRIYNQKGEPRQLLLDATGESKTPDVLEFANNGTVKFEYEAAGLKKTLACREIELGGAVISNTESLLKLGVPFAVSEGDDCETGGASIINRFETTAEGVVGSPALNKVASITVTGTAEPYTATVGNLKMGQAFLGIGLCIFNLNGVAGTVRNVTGEFVEEKPPNLNIQFTLAHVPMEGATGCPKEASLTGNFFLETMSTTTDTAFIG